MTSIRRAEPGDVDAIMSLRQQFWQGQLDFGLLDLPEAFGASREAVTQLVHRRRAVLVLAIQNDCTIGYAAGAVQVAPQLATPSVAILEEIFVSPGITGGGVGRLLSEAVFDALDVYRCTRRQVRVLPGNAPAMAFWHKLGFRTSLVTLEQDREI